MAVVHVTADNFQMEVLQSEKPVLVDFWASWCGPCMMLGPVVEELAETVTDVKICKVNVDEQMDLAQQFKVVSIPMLILFKDGQVAAKDIGVKSKDELLTFMHQ
ncbi:MAG: thioredoxin [Lachnospiraceae bacterium]|nr:thioredoxin [Lachnospiraceae bacterium]